jgi:hypothetical protein
MTDSVTPPDAPLVDPETGETRPLSPVRGEPFVATFEVGMKRAIERDPHYRKMFAQVEYDLPKWWERTFTEEPDDAA